MEHIILPLDEYLKDEAQNLHRLNTEINWNQIPLLNYVPLHTIQDNSLVRFRGMIQDMMDPEIYLEKYMVRNHSDNIVENRIQNGKFRDTLVCKPTEDVDYNSIHNIQADRRSLFMVSIPGYNKWAENIERELNGFNENSLLPSSSNIQFKLPSSCESTLKRTLTNDDDAAMDIQQSENIISPNKRANTMKTSSENDNHNSTIPTAVLSREFLLNSPIPDRPSRACLVKIYEDFERFSLNSVLDIVGFLSVDPVLDGSSHEPTEFEEMAEIQANNPPPSLIPRLHAISIRDVKHLYPLPIDKEPNQFDGHLKLDIYKDIQLALTQCLFGDLVAAEYLMCHLISTVYVRSELQTLGQFCLNLSHLPIECPTNYTKLFYEIIELLLPASHYFPMTLDNMNTCQFVPKKDYTTNKLTSGLLQLAPHTHFLLDETQLAAGELKSDGIETVSNIAHLINNQKIKCNFQYYQIEFNVDIPVLILSEGKSMLPSNTHVPLQPELDCVPDITETLDAVKQFLRPKLSIITKYLASLKLTTFNMSTFNEIEENIQNDFVAMRRDHNATTEDLHTLLVLSRLLGLCAGEECLNSNMWTKAKDLEAERKRRIDVIAASRHNNRH